eukprot:jgi/Chlat1/5129/Chrsp33S05128
MRACIAAVDTCSCRHSRQQTTMGHRTMSNSRVVVHIDMDAFYAQVEQVRLSIDPAEPLAVQQWQGLIAVNYPARAAGVTRHMRIQEALEKCPHLKTVHVEVIGGEPGTTEREQGKVSLERYRRAAVGIEALFRRFTPLCERASIDEAYLDLTSKVEELLAGPDCDTVMAECNFIAPVVEPPPAPAAEQHADYELHTEAAGIAEDEHQVPDSTPPEVPANTTYVSDGSPLDASFEFDRRLMVGAALTSRIRAAVKSELGYTCSAGISFNKLLAKIASSKNKPNKQTVVPLRAVDGLMKELPLKKIRNLGGKLGAELESRGCVTAGDVQAFSWERMCSDFGDRMGSWVYFAVRGQNDDPGNCNMAYLLRMSAKRANVKYHVSVTVKEGVKSMLAAKTFESTCDNAILHRWMEILAEEISMRMTADHSNRQPRTLSLSYRNATTSKDRSKSCPFPHGALVTQEREAIKHILLDAGMTLLRKAGEESFPCCRLALSATNWVDLPAPGKANITSFFGSPAVKTNAESSDMHSALQQPIAVVPNKRAAPNPLASAFARASKKIAAVSTHTPVTVDLVDDSVSVAQNAFQLEDVDVAEQQRLYKQLTHRSATPSTVALPTANGKNAQSRDQRSVASFFSKTLKR